MSQAESTPTEAKKDTAVVISLGDAPREPTPPLGADKEKGIAPAAPVNVLSYKTPKNTLLTIVKAGMAKTQMTWYNTAIMGFMAGIFIGFGGLLSITVAGGINTGAGTLGPGLAKLLYGGVFPGAAHARASLLTAQWGSC
jgi:hypothetical protein